MEHESFPVAGFDFMDEAATDEQKTIILRLASELGYECSSGPWPTPFTKWDAARMIEALEDEKKDHQ